MNNHFIIVTNCTTGTRLSLNLDDRGHYGFSPVPLLPETLMTVEVANLYMGAFAGPFIFEYPGDGSIRLPHLLALAARIGPLQSKARIIVRLYKVVRGIPDVSVEEVKSVTLDLCEGIGPANRKLTAVNLIEEKSK